jgi:hypothetical protein
MLFNIVADMLAIMIERAKINGQFEGVVPHLVDGGLSILQYVMIRLFIWNVTWKRLKI